MKTSPAEAASPLAGLRVRGTLVTSAVASPVPASRSEDRGRDGRLLAKAVAVTFSRRWCPVLAVAVRGHNPHNPHGPTGAAGATGTMHSFQSGATGSFQWRLGGESVL